MAVAAGTPVVPRGAVQAGDHEPVPWTGPGAAAWARCWSCPAERAAALVVAAVRETFEESGILLAGADGHEVLGAVDPAEWEADRAALESGARSFGEVLVDRGLRLRADLLGAWAHWITPAYEPRRFDTRFFVAVLGAGRGHALTNTESERSFWTTPEAALRAADDGEMEMMTPTRHNVQRLVGADPATLLTDAARRTVRAVAPRLIEVDGRLWLSAIDEAADESAVG